MALPVQIAEVAVNLGSSGGDGGLRETMDVALIRGAIASDLTHTRIVHDPRGVANMDQLFQAPADLLGATLQRRPAGLRIRVAGMVLPVVATAFLTSCTAAAPATDPTPAAISAEQVCMELSDVGTLVFNMSSGRAADRIPGEEYQGAMYLAVSMLGHVDESDAPDVNSAVDELKAAAGTNEVNPDSEEWIAAFADVSESCTDVLGEFGVRGWVGG
jgi:hypothetical protein